MGGITPATGAAAALAVGRLGVGLVSLTAPRLTARLLFGNDAGGSAPAVAMFGIRDAALAAGLLRSLPSGARTRDWLLAGAVSDAADAVIVMRHADAFGRRTPLIALAAASGAVAGVACAGVSRRGRDTRSSSAGRGS